MMLSTLRGGQEHLSVLLKNDLRGWACVPAVSISGNVLYSRGFPETMEFSLISQAEWCFVPRAARPKWGSFLNLYHANGRCFVPRSARQIEGAFPNLHRANGMVLHTLPGEAEMPGVPAIN